MSKNVRFSRAEESPKDWSWSGHGSFSSVEETSADYLERIMLPPRMPVRKMSCEAIAIVVGEQSDDEDDQLEEATTLSHKTARPILRHNSRYSSQAPCCQVSPDVNSKIITPTAKEDFGASTRSNSASNLPLLPDQTKKEAPLQQTPMPVSPRKRERRMRNPSNDSLQYVPKKKTSLGSKSITTSEKAPVESKNTAVHVPALETREMEIHWERVPCSIPRRTE